MIEIVMKDSTVEALSQFLNDKEHYLNEMLPEDRFPLIFIRGLLKLQEGAIKSGIHDIEKAAWSGNQIEWLRKASVGAIVGQMENVKGYIPHQQIKEACNQLKMYISDFFANPNSEKLHPDLLPKMEELDPSQYQRIWPNLFVEGIESKALEKYEKAIIKSVKHGKISKFDAALACVDLVQACSHFAEIGMCFLYAMFWLHEDLIEKIRKNVKKEERYALKCLIMYAIQHEQTLSQLRLHPGMQFIMARRSLGIALSTLKLSGELITPEDSEIVVGLFQSIVYNCRLCPFWNAPPVGISEAVLLNIVSGQLHCEYILNMQNIESDALPIHVSELHYQIYENDLKHLAQLKNSENAHARAMEEMMKEKDLTWEDVSGALTCPLTPCDLDGWLTVQSTLGGSPEYSGLKGFVFDTDDKKHSLEILVTSPRFWNRQKGLFSQDDIHAMLQCDLAEIFPIFFSLDQPNPNQRFHPFQQMRYSPEALAGNNVLYTLFHTDYLLKSFSVGSEVSSQPPFEQRKCSDGLTANLPLHLQNILSSISERDETGSQSIHRFSIQAEELKYDVSQDRSKIEYRISEPKMVVRSHPLLPSLDGELRDAKEKDDPNSPEAKFAAELTEHYSEIADHFPMFARLKELCKLQFLCFAINATLSCLKDKSEGTGWNVTDEMVESIHKSERKAYRNNLKNGLRQQRQSIPSELRSNSQAIYQLTNSLETLCKQRVDRSSMEYYVSEWLRYNRDSDLIEMIVSTFPLTTRHEIHQTLVEKFKSEYNSFKSEVITLKEAPKLNTTSKGQCDWVPAAMMKKDDEASYSLCYGGVLFAPKYIQQPIPRTSSSRVPIQPKPPMPPTSAMRSFFSFWGQKEPSRYSSSKGSASLLSKPKYNSHDWKNCSNRDQTNRKNGRDAFLAMATFLVIRRDDRGRKNERKNIKHQKHIPIETIKQRGAHAIKRGANPSTSLTNFLGSGKKSQTSSCGDKRCKCCQFINGSENSGTIVGGYTCKDRNVIYRLTDTLTGKYYIGMTTNQMNKRIIGGHCCKGTVFEYFKGNFEHMRVEVIEHHPGATRKELRAHEKRIIESYPKEKLKKK